MTTKNDLIAQCKAENPKMISIINGEEIELTGADYDKACNDWAEMRLAQIELEIADTQAAADKKTLLAKIGITADEAKLLLS
jgi:hypothetical protein